MIATEIIETAIQRARAAVGEPLLIVVPVTSKVLGVSDATTWRLIASGTLETVLIGRRRLVKYSSVKRVAAEGARR